MVLKILESISLISLKLYLQIGSWYNQLYRLDYSPNMLQLSFYQPTIPFYYHHTNQRSNTKPSQYKKLLIWMTMVKSKTIWGLYLKKSKMVVQSPLLNSERLKELLSWLALSIPLKMLKFMALLHVVIIYQTMTYMYDLDLKMKLQGCRWLSEILQYRGQASAQSLSTSLQGTKKNLSRAYADIF